MSGQATIGIDLGGTSIKAGIVDPTGRVLVSEVIETERMRGFYQVLKKLVDVIRDLPAKAQLSRDDITAVGVGVPGPMSREKGFIYAAPNLPDCHNVPLRDLLFEATQLHVVLENDANAAAFGEYTAGAGRDTRSMVMFTLGTGVGGGVVLNGELWIGSFDNAGELGHLIVVPDGRQCGCGQRGCLESYASATAIAERYAEAVRGGEDGVHAKRLRSGGNVDSAAVADAVELGDPLAARVWGEACTYLAVTCVNLQHTLNTDVVVLGGGLVGAGERLLRPVKAEFARLTWKLAPDKPDIRVGTLGAAAGVIGAATLARIAAHREPSKP